MDLLRYISYLLRFILLVVLSFFAQCSSSSKGGAGLAVALSELLSGSSSAGTSTSSNNTVATPLFSLPSGTYTTTQNVNISTSTSGATILYATDGSDPACPLTGTAYTGSAISIAATTTLKAIACKTGMANSSIVIGNYTIAPLVADPSFSPAPGTYGSAQSVTISTSTAGATILYTNNGTAPQCPSTGTTYGGALSVPSSTTLKAIACKTGMTASSVVTGAYTITGTVAPPTFSLAAGTYTSDVSVSLATITSSASILYTTNGTSPACPSTGTPYTAPLVISVGSSSTVRAIACLTGWTDSTVSQATYNLSSTTPTATVAPASGSTIKPSDTVVIQFSESMDTTSLTTSGTLGSATATWSTTNFANDKLTLAPASSWNTGTGMTLTVNAKDLAGNAAGTINLSYGVVSGVFRYVKTTGSNSSSGLTPSLAVASIEIAIYNATAGDIVLVAGGTYNYNSQSISFPPVKVTLKNGVSVYGGYSQDFQTRNIATNVTTIADTCTGMGCGTMGSNSITTPTTFDGFTVNGGGGGSPGAFFDYGSSSALIISNNTFNGGTSTGGVGSTTTGVYLQVSNATVTRNKIQGGTGGENSEALVCDATTPNVYKSPIITNNTIDGGSATSQSFGISLFSTTPTLRNNTVNGGTAVNGSYGIGMSNSQAAIENNIIFTGSASSRYCIYEMDSVSDPSSFKNNDLFQCPGALYVDNDLGLPTGFLTAICSGNPGNAGCTTTLATPVGSGNVSVDPVFTNQAGGDWHLNAGSPCTVATGGLDLSAYFTADKDGATRTAPFSIGAFEWNGSCL